MTRLLSAAATAVALCFAALSFAVPAAAEKPIWGIQVEQLEYRIGDETDVAAWDFDALYGSDELKLVFRSEAEYAVQAREIRDILPWHLQAFSVD